MKYMNILKKIAYILIRRYIRGIFMENTKENLLFNLGDLVKKIKNKIRRINKQDKFLSILIISLIIFMTVDFVLLKLFLKFLIIY